MIALCLNLTRVSRPKKVVGALVGMTETKTDPSKPGSQPNSEVQTKSNPPVRKVRNFLIDRDLQLIFWKYQLFVLFAVLGATIVSLFLIEVFIRFFIGVSSEEYILVYVYEMVSNNFTLLSLMVFFYFFVSFITIILLTHRVSGAEYAIARLVRNLREGQYSRRVHLRKDDFLKKLAGEINELAESFEKNDPKKGQ